MVHIAKGFKPCTLLHSHLLTRVCAWGASDTAAHPTRLRVWQQLGMEHCMHPLNPTWLQAGRCSPAHQEALGALLPPAAQDAVDAIIAHGRLSTGGVAAALLLEGAHHTHWQAPDAAHLEGGVHVVKGLVK